MNKQKRILIVEDDMILSMVLRKMVQKLNHKVVDTLASGPYAVNVALNRSPDLILMDVQLKGEFDGIEAMKRIKKEKDIPVIYISGNSEPSSKQRAEEIGYYMYMSKPVRMEELEKAITDLFACTSV